MSFPSLYLAKNKEEQKLAKQQNQAPKPVQTQTSKPIQKPSFKPKEQKPAQPINNEMLEQLKMKFGK